MFAPTLALFVAAPLNVFLNWLFVWGPVDSIRLGFAGAPLSTAISMNVMFLVSLLYAVFRAPRNAWGGLSMAVFEDLGVNIRLGLAGYCLVGSEWLSWEAVGLASSFLGPTVLASQSVLLTSASLFYQIPYSLSVAAAVRTGSQSFSHLLFVLLADSLSHQIFSVVRSQGELGRRRKSRSRLRSESRCSTLCCSWLVETCECYAFPPLLPR